MLKPPWRFGAEAPQRIAALVLKWPGRFGIGTLGGLGPTKLGLSADWSPRSRGPQLFRCFLKGIRGNDNDGRGGESRWLHQAYFAQRDLPGRDGKICTIETIECDKIRPVKPSCMAGFAR